jgi:hypothetical protein
LHDVHLCSWVYCHVTEDLELSQEKHTYNIHYASKIIFAIPVYHSVSAQLDLSNCLGPYFSSPFGWINEDVRWVDSRYPMETMALLSP